MSQLQHLLLSAKANWRAGLTVALVSVPLSLALTVASGGTPWQGILSAIVAGALAGWLGGSPHNITGPTGALSGLLVAYAVVHGPLMLPWVALLSGLLILLYYGLQIAKFIIFIPRSVVLGFTLGVALIIALGQVDNALGLAGLAKSPRLLANFWDSLGHWREAKPAAALLFAASLAFILLWNKRFPRLPGAVLVATAGIALSALAKALELPTGLTLLGDLYSLRLSELNADHLQAFRPALLLDKDLWMVSFGVSLIAVLETLLSAQVARQMTKAGFDRRKEVFGLALANIATGLVGGLPSTAALARTALNIKSGGRDKTAAVINALFVALISLFLLKTFSLLPMPIIAAILVSVAVGMVETHQLTAYMRHERFSLFMALFVAAVALVEDPMVAILFGTSVAMIRFVNEISKGQTEVLLWKDQSLVQVLLKDDFLKRQPLPSDLAVYKISGSLTYLNMPAHLEAVAQIRGNRHVVLSVRHVFLADYDGVELLAELVELLKRHNDKIVLSGVNHELEPLLRQQPFYQQKLVEGKVFRRSSDAINAILGRASD